MFPTVTDRLAPEWVQCAGRVWGGGLRRRPLIVLDDVTSVDGRAVDTIVGDILTRLDVIVSPLLRSAARFDELRARERRLVAEIDREGIPV